MVTAERDALVEVADLLGIVVARLRDAVPAVGRVVVDVERDWLDERGREWVERAVIVRRALDADLDGALATLRVVGDALSGEAPVHETVPLGGGSGGGRSAGGGPRLAGTEARRVDDERGVHIARLGEDGGEPG